MPEPSPPESTTTDASSVQEGYDRWAEVYDHDANPLVALEEPRVQALSGEVRGKDVLDLGCGTGRHTSWLANAGARVTAVDFSSGMLAKARAKITSQSVVWLAHDLHHPLPLPDASFDIVVSGLVLEHLQDLSGFFSEVSRLLRPNGYAVVSAMHPAMFLRGAQARFTDPQTGIKIQPGSLPHTISEFVMSALAAQLTLESLEEHAPNAEFARRYPRAEKYVDWPMLTLLRLRA